MDQLIQHIQGFLPISDESITKFVGKFDTETVPKRTHLLQFDHYANAVYFTLSGVTRTYITDREGVEHNVSFATENWWFGDLQSFIERKPATFSIQALEETQVLTIRQEAWETLIEEASEFLGYVGLLFRNSMFAQQNRIVQNLSFTAAERYQAFLEEYPTLSQRISQKHIASYLGITPEFLSALRRNKRSS
ncbi:MAG: Crp/Fnr family transcriptional regulator [Bacteroidota bacterium]